MKSHSQWAAATAAKYTSPLMAGTVTVREMVLVQGPLGRAMMGAEGSWAAVTRRTRSSKLLPPLVAVAIRREQPFLMLEKEHMLPSSPLNPTPSGPKPTPAAE